MQLCRLSIVPAFLLSLALAACGTEPPASKTVGAENVGAIAAEQPVMGPERRILAFGDSLFAGYNVAQEDSYPAKLEGALRAQGINARVTNAGVSGDTTAAGLQRLTFTLDAQEERPDLFILELGGNDLLRGIQPNQTRSNIEAMLNELKKRDIPVLLMGMRAPPNFAQFQADFDNLYPELAAKYGSGLVPFFLDSIYTKPELIQPDRIHPTEVGIETLVGATVDAVKGALPEAE
ncbi:arylesterase [Pontixanthobacter gangjinensis]|uniref:Arylesterase n=1 Tax=Pontixanthobacter gangjinensis TaxID=1028742 RepID=A0A6I4SQD7_9SPHN|nr:arylesterase [Pontixanthobacter gangjinensis]MXO57578.1 arylesterase [Pontixanthobacter gangjinensis]